jgi:hypothetical protein
MTKYVIEAPHVPEECLNDLDEMSAKAPEILNKFVWGCAQGEHKGWAYIDAKSKEDVLAALPKSVQEKVKVTEVTKLTPKQIKSFHEK